MKNKPKINLKAIEQVAITISLMLILLFGNALAVVQVSSADDAPNPADAPIVPLEGSKAEVSAITAVECQKTLADFGDPEFVKYTQYMEDNFKNKSNTSSLMGMAMKRYEKFKIDIMAELELLEGRQINFADQSGASLASQLPGLAACENAARDYISNAAKMLQMRAVTTSGIKKALIIVEKYQQINTKLRALDLNFMKMVVSLTAFEQKLPCYLKTCT